jgi:threonine synthase
MTTRFRAVRCVECGHEAGPDLYLRACPACGGAWLDAVYDLAGLAEAWPADLAGRPSSLWRYAELLPFGDDLVPVTMGEGWTPLTAAPRLEAELGGPEIWVKDERQQPTGSFKDRQAACTVSALAARGIDQLVLASTGNAAAAYAAFAARAGIKLWVFLASSVPAEKMRELALYGAEVVKITGTYDQAKAVAADFARRRGIWMDAGAKAIPGKESMKTVAFEIAEQTGWQGVDWYVQAVSGGIGPLGVMKGFKELVAAGLLPAVPKLGLVQVAGCAPMVRAWEQGADTAEPVEADTLITVLATGDPGLAYGLLKADADRHGGAMVAVSDGDAFRAMRRVARLEGLSVEPAACVAFAGLEQLVEAGHIGPGERVVVNCSGHTFSAEKHALEDRYVVHLQTHGTGSGAAAEGLVTALEQLDEQVTTIAIIDDNPYDSRLIRRLLQGQKNYRIYEAHSGPDGIDLVRQRRPDLVVLDLMMPDLDGFAILDRLKADARTAQIPVVIVSAKSLSAEEAERLERLSESVWLKGNFSARELVSHVVETLGDALEAAEGPPGEAVEGLDGPRSEPVHVFGQSERPRILVADGNPLDARLMRRLFEARGRFEVVEVHSGEAARRAVEASPPDLVVMDLNLPDVSGQELLLWLRANKATRNVPTIVVASGELDPDAQSRLAPFAASVWSKTTMDRSSLLTAVETMLTE